MAGSARMPERIVADWLTARPRKAVFDALAARGFAVRAVGGAVRNALLGLPVEDVDLATDALPRDIMSAAAAAGLKALPTGIAHGTVTIVEGGVATEVTTLREDVETHGRHARVAFTDDWAKDASRRDFTMNALYCDADGRLYDPLDGYGDLVARRVRFIGDPDQRIREDFLRILRFFRFTARYGVGPLDAAGIAACVRQREGLARLSAERVRQELLRILAAPRAGDMMTELCDWGLASSILGRAPRVRPLLRMIALETAMHEPASRMRRLGALALDVEEDAQHLHARLRLSNAEAHRLIGMLDLRNADAAPAAQAVRRLAYQVGMPGARDALLFAWARSDAGADAAAWQADLQLLRTWQPPTFPLGGSDVLALGVPAGPAVGTLLADLQVQWLDSDFTLTEAELRARLAAAVRPT